MAIKSILFVSILVYITEGAYKISPFKKLSFRNVETSVNGNVQTTTSVLYCSQLCALNLNCITLSYYHFQKLCTIYSQVFTSIDFVPSEKDIYFYGKRVNGNWGGWSTYTQCTVTCGGGTQTRSRSCDNPSPSYGGIICPGTSTEIVECNTSVCPVDGNWGTWSSYSQCTVTCGGGTQTRSRSCDNPSPSNGGTDCVGSSTENQACSSSLCPVNGNWGSWSGYSQCSVTCGGGTKTRTRLCDDPSPSNGGSGCVGSSSENPTCNTSPCPDAVCYSKSGYDYNGSTRTCIKISSSPQTFENAKSECESEGGTLFKMDSASKRDFLKSLVENKGISGSGLFIGARDAGTLEYKWLDGTNVNWIGNPPTTNDQNCVRYDISSSEMDETFCTNNLKYICEQIV